MTLRLLLMLAALCAGLGWTGLQLQAALNDTPPESPAPGEAAVVPDKSDFVVSLPPAAFVPQELNEAALLDRALFEPTRKRPAPPTQASPEAPTAAKPAAPAPPQDLTAEILGTILQDGKDILVMQAGSGTAILRISVGDTVQGWELVEITSSGAKFRSGERTTSLQLLLE